VCFNSKSEKCYNSITLARLRKTHTLAWLPFIVSGFSQPKTASPYSYCIALYCTVLYCTVRLRYRFPKGDTCSRLDGKKRYDRNRWTCPADLSADWTIKMNGRWGGARGVRLRARSRTNLYCDVKLDTDPELCVSNNCITSYAIAKTMNTCLSTYRYAYGLKMNNSNINIKLYTAYLYGVRW